jgi:hypothetical protein
MTKQLLPYITCTLIAQNDTAIVKNDTSIAQNCTVTVFLNKMF